MTDLKSRIENNKREIHELLIEPLEHWYETKGGCCGTEEATLQAISHISEIFTGFEDIIRSLEAKVAQQQWQPIESAPRDGSEFIIFRYSEASDWCKHLYPKGIPTLDTTKWYDDLLGYDYMWQPLPQPSKDTK